MKTKTPTINVSPRFSLRLAPILVVAAVFILSVAAQLTYAAPGDLFESDTGSGNIYEFTPGGTRSTFASGLIILGLTDWPLTARATSLRQTRQRQHLRIYSRWHPEHLRFRTK